jgi:acetyl esterase/lipase
MGLRLRALNLYLRLAVKRPLKRMRDPLVLRRRLERDAARFFVPPDRANFAEDTVRAPAGNGCARPIAGTAAGPVSVPVLWASRNRPDRRKVILYLHGGAYIAGSPRTHRHLGAALAGAAGARAVLPDYRLAPDHPFPAALEDALAVYRHLLGLGYAPGEIAVAGDSAGGGLAFALLLCAARDGLPRPACAVGFSPWVDLSAGQPSLQRNARRDVMLPAGRAAEVARLYLGAHDPADPLASPLFGAWRDPPPALIMASRSEILVDEAIGLAEALRKGGGDVRLELWRGLPHAWPIFFGLIGEADAAVAHAGAFIARHLDPARPPDREPA